VEVGLGDYYFELPRNVPAALRHWRRAMRMLQRQSSTPAYDRVLTSMVTRLLQRGAEEFAAGRKDEAERCLAEATSLRDPNSDVLNQKGLIYFQAKEFDKAIQVWNMINVQRLSAQQKSLFYHNTGSAFMMLKNYQKAIENLSLAIRNAGSGVQTVEMSLNNRGYCYLSTEKYDQALVDFNHAIRLKIDWANPYRHRANTLWKQGKLEEAMESFDNAVRCKPNYKDAWLDRAKLCAELKLYDDAIDDLNVVMSLDPADTDVEDLFVKYSQSREEFDATRDPGAQPEKGRNGFIKCLRSSLFNRPRIMRSELGDIERHENVEALSNLCADWTERLLTEGTDIGSVQTISSIGLAVRFDKTKGRGLQAMRDFQSGEVILLEKPLAVAARPKDCSAIPCYHCMHPIYPSEAMDTSKTQMLVAANLLVFCPHCSKNAAAIYCSDRCQQEAWRYHRFFCPQNPDVEESDKELLLELSALITDDDELNMVCKLLGIIFDRIDEGQPQEKVERLLKYFHHNDTGMRLPNADHHRANDIVHQLFGSHPQFGWVMDKRIYYHLLSCKKFNSFRATIANSQITAVKNVGCAMCPLMALINHECVSNAGWFSYGEYANFGVAAIRNISAGEEICISYVDATESYQKRQDVLRLSWQFNCGCDKCKEDLYRELSRLPGKA